jgi:hypothetical protein
MSELTDTKTTARPEGRPEIVAICGSTRFICGIAALAWQMEKEGIIVLAPMLLPAGVVTITSSDSTMTVGDHAAEAEGVKEIIDELFLRKIDLADRLLVYNQDGYIGESTRNEIEYAKSLGKSVHYLFRPIQVPEEHETR